MKKLPILLLSAAAAIVLASCNTTPSGSSSSAGDSGSSSPSTSDSGQSTDSTSDSGQSTDSTSSSSEATLADPVLTGFEGLVGYGTEGQPYTLTVAPNGSATFHGLTDVNGQQLDLDKLTLAYSAEGIVNIDVSQSLDDKEYAQVDFAVTAVAEGSTTLTITDPATSYTVTITVGEDDKWGAVEEAWAQSALATDLELDAPVEPNFAYTSAEFSTVTEGKSYAIRIYAMDNSLDAYMAQLEAVSGYSAFVKDSEGFYSFKLATDPGIILEGAGSYTDGEIVVSFSYPDPFITSFQGLSGFGTEGQPYSLSLVLNGSATFHGLTEITDPEYAIPSFTVRHGTSGIVTMSFETSVDGYGYLQIDFTVNGIAQGNTTLTICDSATIFTIEITVGEDNRWDALEAGWNASALKTDMALDVPPAPTFDYTSAEFDTITEGTVYAIRIYTMSNHLADYMTQLARVSGYSNFLVDTEGFYSFEVTVGTVTLSGAGSYADGEITVSYTYSTAGAKAVITMLSGVTGWQNPYSFTATVGEISYFCGYTDATSELDLSGVSVTSSADGIATVEVSQSLDSGYYQVDFAITGVEIGTTTLTIVDAGNTTYTVDVTVEEAVSGAWANVLSTWNSTNLVNYYGASTAPVEPSFPYTDASFVAEESPWMTGSYTLSITAAADYWETYVNALSAADAAYQNYTWNFGAYDAETNSYPLTVIESLTGACTYDTAAGAIVISFAAAQ